MSTIERMTVTMPAERAAFIKALRNDIDKGLADIAAGRVKPFDAGAIVARGRALLADTRSA
ncbi:hypothetical protein [Sphingobium sp. TCM1]|uniref:hypothetical protein n=1 Tax=Sphingobium sp. TCM1 TaxID=453246 RepID=UPI0007F40E64|nr:hypothetical protein [Sphingobium sp. TCM1]OAN59460.1 hypothetical protein A7Q26_00910 [Sphingobium sp. TCM1]